MKLFKLLFEIFICLFLSIGIDANAKNHNSVQGYFNYVDTQHKPRILIVGCGYCCEKDKDYFCLDIREESNADYTCDIATKDIDTIEKLEICQWDYIVFEHIAPHCALTRGGTTNTLKLLKIGGTISSHTYPYLENDENEIMIFPQFIDNENLKKYSVKIESIKKKYINLLEISLEFRETILQKLNVPIQYSNNLHLSINLVSPHTSYDPRYIPNQNCLFNNYMLLITKLKNL